MYRAFSIVLLLMFFSLTGAAYVFAETPEQKNYPQRIVSLGPINTENVFLLGAGERLVGNTHYCVRPIAARSKEKVGSVLEFSFEKVVRLRPDIILATGLTPKNYLKKLRDIGLTVEVFEQPRSLSESCSHLLRLGKLLGLETKAATIVEQVKREVEAISNVVSQLPPQKVFLQIGSQPLYGAVDDSFTHDFIELINGINVIGDQSRGRTNYEKVIVKNPDVILIAIMGSETGIAGQEKRKWQQYSVIQAVRQERVHIVDPDLVCSPSPVTFVQALHLIAGLVYPQATLEER